MSKIRNRMYSAKKSLVWFLNTHAAAENEGVEQKHRFFEEIKYVPSPDTAWKLCYKFSKN